MAINPMLIGGMIDAYTTAALQEQRLREQRKFTMDFEEYQRNRQERAWKERYDIQRKDEERTWLDRQKYLADPANMTPAQKIQYEQNQFLYNQQQEQAEREGQYRQTMGGLRGSVSAGTSPQNLYQQAQAIEGQFPVLGKGLSQQYAPGEKIHPMETPEFKYIDDRIKQLEKQRIDIAKDTYIDKTYQKSTLAQIDAELKSLYSQRSQAVPGMFPQSTPEPTPDQVAVMNDMMEDIRADLKAGTQPDIVVLKLVREVGLDEGSARQLVKESQKPKPKPKPKTVIERAQELMDMGVPMQSAYLRARREIETPAHQKYYQRSISPWMDMPTK